LKKKRLVSASYVRVTDADKSLIGNINNEEISCAIERYLENEVGQSPADMFLKKLRAITGSVATSVQASQKARQNMLSMIVRYGSPAIFFTISPSDLFSFRIMIMSGKENLAGIKWGHKDPPTMNCSTHQLKEFVLNSANIRTSYPGLCSFDFENIIHITINDLLGWDTTKKINKPNTGIFGELDGYCYAVEEQGRKTLHAHFLIWLKGWTNVLDGLGDVSQRDNYAEALKTYSYSIQSNILHKGREIFCDCGNSLMTNSRKCTDQDIRNLRCENIATSIGGGQAILMCINCNKNYSSNELATLAVDKELNYATSIISDDEEHFDIESLWFKNSVNSKRQALLELSVMREFIKQKKEFNMGIDNSIPLLGSTRYKTNMFLINALRNLHSSDHSPSCFKKKDSVECRMKIPKRKCDHNDIKFEENGKRWYTWEGEQNLRFLFSFEGERCHEDCYVNTNNEIVSGVFGCNSNVTNAVDGGSIMYITMYASKDTQKDDKKSYTEGARIMVRKLNEKIQMIDCNDDSNSQDHDSLLAGIKALIGASFIATKAKICSSTMASYLVRNHSRFQFSHYFAPVNLNDYYTEEVNDLTIDSTNEGLPFVKSNVLNYIHRPKHLDDTCLYDFTSEYVVYKNSRSTMTEDENDNQWSIDHPSRQHLTVRKRKIGKTCTIPRITYRDFVDTKYFGGNIIDTCDEVQCTESERYFMEKYAKNASLLFIPFRSSNGVTDDNRKYLPDFKQFLLNPPEKFVTVHQHLLKNIQDCHNKFNCGRQLDALEKVTNKPDVSCGVSKQAEKDNECIEMYDCLISNMENIFTDNVCFRTDDNTFSMVTSLIRNLGAHKCGATLLRAPTVDKNASVFLESCMVEGTTLATHTPHWDKTIQQKLQYKQNLYQLSIRMTERITNEDGITTEIVPSGSLENIREYGSFVFKDDQDQVKAFELIVAAFVVELYKIPDALGKRQRSLESTVKKLKEINHKGQFVAFLSGPGGTGKSRVIHAVIRYCKLLCEKANIGFNKRTITVTALTGAAAVSIFGETTHGACSLNGNVTAEKIDEWKDAKMLIVDEISFASEHVLATLNKKLNLLKETGNEKKFGNIPIVFAGDFTQL